MKKMHFYKSILNLLIIYSVSNAMRDRIKTKVLNVISYFQDSLLERKVESARYTSDVKIWCRKSLSETAFLLVLNDGIGASLLDRNLPLAFVLHGWMDEGGAEWLEDMQTTWIRYRPWNVCVVDWKMFAKRDYKLAMMKTFDVAKTIAETIQFLELYGFSRENVTIAGFSLGAHAAGHTGSLLKGQLGQIIGLDPAGPLFTVPVDIGPKYRLDKTDAKFVQVMHTAGGTLGTHVKSGHADFYPNGGVSPQTHCLFLDQNDENTRKHPVGCSHSMGVKYFKMSLNPAIILEGVQCSSYRFFLFGFCKQNRKSRFGLYSDRTPGNYFFTMETDVRSTVRLSHKKWLKTLSKLKA